MGQRENRLGRAGPTDFMWEIVARATAHGDIGIVRLDSRRPSASFGATGNVRPGAQLTGAPSVRTKIHDDGPRSGHKWDAPTSQTRTDESERVVRAVKFLAFSTCRLSHEASSAPETYFAPSPNLPRLRLASHSAFSPFQANQRLQQLSPNFTYDHSKQHHHCHPFFWRSLFQLTAPPSRSRS